MRVVVADDVLFTRAGLVRLLRGAGVEWSARPATWTRCARRAAPARRGSSTSGCRRRTPTRDWSPPPGSARSYPGTGVLVLSQYVEPSYAMRLIEDHPEGVGYLLKERVFDVGRPRRRAAPGQRRRDRGRPDHRRPPGRPATPDRSPRRADRARARGARAGRRGPLEPRDRGQALRHRAHRRGAHQADLPQARPRRRQDSHRRVLAVLTYLRAAP